MGEGVSVEAYHPASRRGHLKDDDADEGIGLFQVHAMGWRLFPGRNLTHPGIVENGVLVMVVPRTNLGGATSKREQDFGSDGRGFESLRARQFSF